MTSENIMRGQKISRMELSCSELCQILKAVLNGKWSRCEADFIQSLATFSYLL